MKITLLLILLLCTPAIFFKSDDNPNNEDDMLVLTDTTFHQAIEQYENLFVNFYAPWSGHCKVFNIEFAKAAQMLTETETGLDVKFATVDFTIEKELAQKYEIKHYPTLLLFSRRVNYSPIAYDGQRTASDLIDWLKKKTFSNSIEIKALKDTEVLIKNSEVLVLFFGPSDTEAFQNFLKVSIAFDDVTFAHSHDQAVADESNVRPNSIILFRKFDRERIVLPEATSFEVIQTFIIENKNPTFFPPTEKAFEKIFREGLDALILIKSDNEDSQKAEEIFQEISQEVEGKLVLSILDINDSFGAKFVDFIKVDIKQYPAILLARPSKKYWKYLFEDEINIENLRSFIQDFSDNKLKPFLKSEPIPDQPYEDDVLVVVGKNHNEIVLDDNTDVLIEYYAFWDGHAKSFAPVYSALAKEFKNVQGLKIAKMDWTANEVEGLEVDRYPQIRFYPKGKKHQFLDYSGSLTLENLSNFLKKESILVQQYNKFIVDNSLEL